MARVSLPDPTESEDPEVRELAERVADYKGHVANHFRIEANAPAVFKHVYRARLAAWEESDLPAALLKKIAIAVSMHNDCEYCTGAYCSLLSADLDEGGVREFQRRLADGDLAGLEGDAIEFCLLVNDDPHAVTDDHVRLLRDEHGLTDGDLVQLVYVVNIVAGYNRVTTVFDAEYDHSYPSAWADPEADA